ncbi:hypothetical protein D7Z54_28255 [Salibacterium salarium]|uniref:Uncharacterized protein n=1 Tax=Salibacterium salarium TaxID=284579 RepID=A0A428MV45_9BACI|nr:hypothetical protein [Salibacterium salarium]RSL29998.1 hypothetical protein D7Z54_28255 [Salibacterium salarium]
MKTFKVIYYLDKEFTIDRIIEAETKEEAIHTIQEESDKISFTDSKGIYNEINRSDVKLIRLGQAVKRRTNQQNVN